jgi:hypothetical protein
MARKFAAVAGPKKDKIRLALDARLARESGGLCVVSDGKALWRCPECGERYYLRVPQVCRCGEERER